MADHLRLVPKRPPDPAETVRTRAKRHPKPDGMLQCPKCGSRSACKVENGVAIKRGKRTAGTVIVKDVCADCWKQGVIVDMRSGEERPERVK